MKRFNFKMEKVLKLRKFSEEQAKIELGKAIGFLTGIENQINNNARTRYNAANSRFSSVNDIISWDLFISRLDKEKEKLLEEAAKAELIVEEKRSLFLEASRDLKVMEKLKDKEKDAYKKEYNAEEVKMLDDQFRRSEQWSVGRG